MTPEERNIATLHEANRLWHETKGGSIDHWLSLIADDGKMSSLAAGRTLVEFSKSRQKREGARAYLTELTAAWSMNFHRIEDYIADGNRVATTGEVSWTNKATGKVCTTKKVDIWTFDDAGKAVDFFEMYDTAALLAAAQPG